MNLERGFSVPTEESDVWAPVTQEKPVQQRSKPVKDGMQQNGKGVGNWQDLLGIYTDVLQDGSYGLLAAWSPRSRREPPIQNFGPASTLLNRVPQSIGPAGVIQLHNSQGVAFAELSNKTLPCRAGSTGLAGANRWSPGIQDVAPVDIFRSFDQNGGNASSYLQNVGDVVSPRKVNSLAELLGMGKTLSPPSMNGDVITSAVNTAVQNQDIGGYNLQQMPSSRISVAYRPSYNLNFPQRSEDRDSSSVSRPFHLGPATPDQHRLLKNSQISQIPHLLIEESLTKEENNEFMQPQQAEIGESEHDDFVSDTLSTASPDVSTTEEKQNIVGGNNGEFYLNETPPQKAPKRRKHRPKVVKEEKPRRTPKPAANENKTPGGDPPPKRKYVSKKDIRSSTNQSFDAENGAAVRDLQPQGRSCDRRFSKWKGSVVDSVIGVYLTQNVSDHLSSSAFMSLAAKFPIKSTNTRDTSCQNAGNPSAEYVVRVTHPDGTTCHQRMTREPVYDHNTPKSSKLSEYDSEKVPSGTVNKDTRRTEECIVSSQSSSGSMSFQASEDIRSSSGSNSEVEDQVTVSHSREIHGPLYLFEEARGIAEFQKNQIQEMGVPYPDKMFSNDHQEYENLANMDYPGVAISTNACAYPLTANVLYHQTPATTSNSPWQGLLMGTGNRETDVFASLEKECTSSLSSTFCDTTSRTVIEVLHNKAGRSMESRLVEQQTPSYKLQASTVNHEVHTKHLEKEMDLPIESESSDYQHFMNNKLGGMQETFQKESILLTDPIKSAEALRQNPTGNKKLSVDSTLEPTEMKTVHASDVQSSRIGTNSTARKQKAEKEKEKSFNWDSIRTHVQSKGGTRGRSRDIMDSLDYEALRNADIHEISDSIKERGMNNMLAARIKDFLNRLVKDHGSIDLEWLRDAQPDKVKDYLLSIRGLGLKSVECIHLLTLRHLAFPVDTNVGRIAVRLGWVPLQPLPESLQLHLLELYPVLESIQKYLWPRLCMLDQETLYELHYQLITFGKVFCTKRKPNCDACPMRGECRHFASAFASARLALPGPEEKRIVCSDISTDSSKCCGIVTKPMSLPPPEDNMGSGPGFTINCEPIIEETATPESSIEDTERDIEDAFYEEDPDEIPEIKLNIEEFTTNLKSFIQENKEMQEGDMSKSIIALSPQLGSIPTPKLKHVSRLRTEHQVYELPDSHPLLEGMDRREPDDPSPYLLALWTPGETADSIQLPGGNCSSNKSGMCNNKTCSPCNSTREAHAQTVQGTILIPCRTAMRGSFPLNGTYFQVNEVFADDKTSRDPIHVPRSSIWNLPRRTVFFGTSVSTIFKGMSTEGIQYCFWKGFICVRGFDQKTRAPRPLKARLHLPASQMPKKN